MVGTGERIRDRLGELARRRGAKVDLMVLRFCMERFLARLAASPYRDGFALKGALLVAVWHGDLLRSTGDIDLHCLDPNGKLALPDVVAAICATATGEDDGVEFDPAGSRRAGLGGAAGSGDRFSLPARVGGARLAVQVDIGFGHAVTPGLERRWYPGLLPGFKSSAVLCYPRETVVAEKLAVAVEFGRDNTRLRDYFDLREISRRHAFPAHALADAVTATFARRDAGSFLDGDASYWEGAFEPEFATPQRCRAWQAWLRNHAPDSGIELPDAVAEVASFALPLLHAVRDGSRLPGYWEPSAGWSRKVRPRLPVAGEASL